MTTFCDCATCKEIKKKMKNPKCKHCGEHHDPAICCPEYAQHLGEKTFYCESVHPICDLCSQKHNPRVKCREYFKDPKNRKPEIDDKKISYKIDVANGKYTVISYEDGGMKALRHGEEWQDLCGNNLVFFLMVELIEAKDKIKQTLELIDSIEDYTEGQLVQILLGEKE